MNANWHIDAHHLVCERPVGSGILGAQVVRFDLRPNAEVTHHACPHCWRKCCITVGAGGRIALTFAWTTPTVGELSQQREPRT